MNWPSHVLQYALRLDSGDRCCAMLSTESGVAGPEAGKLMVWSPKNNLLAMLLRYQARGNARISLRRLMSYLKEAEPISHTAEMLIRVVSIFPPLLAMKVSNAGHPVRLIRERLTFTNSRLMERESFLPVTEEPSSSAPPSGPGPGGRPVTADFCLPAP